MFNLAKKRSVNSLDWRRLYCRKILSKNVDTIGAWLRHKTRVSD